MKIILALSLCALVGCATKPTIRGVSFNSDGSIVNVSGQELRRVVIEGEMWTHGKRVNVLPQKIGDWPDGESLTLQWKVESIDRFDLFGRCEQGKFYAVFPPHSPAATPPPDDAEVHASGPAPAKAADKSTWRDGVPPCYKCWKWHWPDQPHINYKTDGPKVPPLNP